jgi:hypothetical protein
MATESPHRIFVPQPSLLMLHSLRSLYSFCTLFNDALTHSECTAVAWMHVSDELGRAIAQAVSRRLPTPVVRVGAQVRLCGICGGQSGSGADFLQVLRFPLPILVPPIAPHSSSIIQGWYNRPISDRRTKILRTN